MEANHPTFFVAVDDLYVNLGCSSSCCLKHSLVAKASTAVWYLFSGHSPSQNAALSPSGKQVSEDVAPVHVVICSFEAGFEGFSIA